jgi:hypothetical protein
LLIIRHRTQIGSDAPTAAGAPAHELVEISLLKRDLELPIRRDRLRRPGKPGADKRIAEVRLPSGLDLYRNREATGA